MAIEEAVSLNKKMVMLTVVVPTYNCARWLERAVLSTQALGVCPIEVFIVDDGSTDDTPSLGLALATSISGVRYLHQRNAGLSAARNFGLAHATGAYVLLLDADDELLPCNLLPVLKLDLDIIRVGMEELDNVSGAITRNLENFPKQSGRAYLRDAFLRNDFYTPSCVYIYRRDFLVLNQLKFKHGLLHEDNLFTVQALMAATSMIAVPEVVYRYIHRANSITTAMDRAKLVLRILAYSDIAKDLTNIANRELDFDLRWKIEEVIGGALHLAEKSGGFGPVMTVLLAQIRYMASYRGHGAPGFRYKQRRDLLRVLALALSVIAKTFRPV